MRNFIFVIASLFTFSTFSFSQPTQTKEKLTCIDKTFSVVVHIVKDSLHKTNVSEAAIIASIEGASSYFAPICVSFKVCEIRYIDNYAYEDIDKDLDFPEMRHQYNVKNRINVYYVKGFKGLPNAGFATLKGIQNTDDQGIVMRKDKGLGIETMAHEMGHYWGLYHTFEAVEHGPELADGSNCSTAGDLVCDTPADPYVNPEDLSPKYINGACQFVYMGQDTNKQYYDPHTTNIMSYYLCNCGTFTDGQFQRMVSTYLGKIGMW
ncbi:MAG TPA: zinc-dependent metalloprotease family protein [Bacteroidia bacterium]|jgi:hypothetical protein|nr:zinc-dependent metalloprotease family protein [Bacteroidia bacterium]HRG51530.1 zinc-dependent metalloprotease family protein [Bacteroidia bacterium]